MILLGIDPGLAQTGHGVVRHERGRFQALDFGRVRTQARTPMPERVASIHEAVAALLREYDPQTLVLERLYALRDGSTGLAIGQAMGAILLAAHQGQVPVVEYTPTQVKRAVVGYGQATKEQVQFMVQRLLHLAEPPRPNHAADALALCICHTHTTAGGVSLPPSSEVAASASSSLTARVAAALQEDEERRAAHRKRDD